MKLNIEYPATFTFSLNFRPLDHVLVCGGGVRDPPLHPLPHLKGIWEQGG